MCRLYGFRSAIDSSVHDSLIRAENALAHQSKKHRDGWGMGYYVEEYPHLIRNDQQALGDELFREVSGIVSTRAFVAHIRLATAGAIRVLNCHPFQHGRWTFAHNGEISGYSDPAVRQTMRELIDPRFRQFVLGDTDSEAIFYVFLSQLGRRVANIHEQGVTASHTADALASTVEQIRASVPDASDERPNRLTFLLTNGNVMIGYRFRRELYFSTYKVRCPERDSCYAFESARCEAEVQDGIVKHLILSSEPVAEGPNVWCGLDEDEYVCVDHGMNFHRGRLCA